MHGLPKQSVWIAALVIAAMAAFGIYEGVQKGATPVGADDQPLTAAVTPPAAGPAPKPATALPEPPAPAVAALSESQIRSIVRQEVQAQLNKPPAEPAEPAPLNLQAPRPLSIPPVVRPPGDTRSDAELLSGVGGQQ